MLGISDEEVDVVKKKMTKDTLAWAFIKLRAEKEMIARTVWSIMTEADRGEVCVWHSKRVREGSRYARENYPPRFTGLCLEPGPACDLANELRFLAQELDGKEYVDLIDAANSAQEKGEAE